MILDVLTRLSSAQQVTADAVSTNTYDAGNVTPKRKLAVGEPMCMIVAITALGTTTGSSKLQAIMSAASNLGTPTIVGEVDLATADIAVGKVYIIPIAAGLTALRYWGVNHDITGTVDYTVDTYGPMPLAHAATLAETYAKGYTV
jgi:hypothetical protein